MPLRDHFHAPFGRQGRWDAVLGMFPGMMTAALNQILPERYAAGPRIQINSLNDPFLIVPEDEPEITAAGSPTLTAPDEWSNVDTYEVRVHDRELCRDLVAAVQIVSPSNKNTPEHRCAFVAKCGAILQKRVSLTIIDFVTDNSANLYAELMGTLGLTDPSLDDSPSPIYVVTIRVRLTRKGRVLESWFNPLAIGQPLPQLPLWLAEDIAVPLDLEPLYEQTLKSLRIR